MIKDLFETWSLKREMQLTYLNEIKQCARRKIEKGLVLGKESVHIPAITRRIDFFFLFFFPLCSLSKRF